MKTVSLDTLKEKIARPDFEKRLVPLLHFKGSSSLGRIHRFWNMTVAMMEAECETIGQGVTHYWGVGEHSHLCEPPTKPAHLSFYGFLSRLKAKREVAELIPGLHDYASMLFPSTWALTPVSIYSPERHHAWWREYRAPLGKRSIPNARKPYVAPTIKTTQMVYPFLIHDGGRPEHDMLRAINAAVPKHLSPDLRADICQDLCVAVLCGDISLDNIKEGVKATIKEVRRMFPDKYGPLSLDAPMPGTENFTLLDTLSTEDGAW